MKTRIKLLLAGAVLGVLTLSTQPAEAFCRVQPTIVDSEAECESLCYSGGCYGYRYSDGGCFCN